MGMLTKELKQEINDHRDPELVRRDEEAEKMRKQNSPVRKMLNGFGQAAQANMRADYQAASIGSAAQPHDNKPRENEQGNREYENATGWTPKGPTKSDADARDELHRYVEANVESEENLEADKGQRTLE